MKNKVFAALLLPQIWTQSQKPSEEIFQKKDRMGLIRLMAPIGPLAETDSKGLTQNYSAPLGISGIEFVAFINTSIPTNLGFGAEILRSPSPTYETQRTSTSFNSIFEVPFGLAPSIEFVSRIDLGVRVVPEHLNQSSQNNFIGRLSPSFKFENSNFGGFFVEIGPEFQILNNFNVRGNLRLGLSL